MIPLTDDQLDAAAQAVVNEFGADCMTCGVNWHQCYADGVTKDLHGGYSNGGNRDECGSRRKAAVRTSIEGALRAFEETEG